jgi:hypothetical protein
MQLTGTYDGDANPFPGMTCNPALNRQQSAIGTLIAFMHQSHRSSQGVIQLESIAFHH